jgi:23S rRNA-/tRNA-specific pseudouridylate synthase
VEILRTHPCGLAALYKPPDILAHPNRAADRARALLTAAFDADDESFSWTDAATGATHRVWLLHRLDAATSGVVLVAARADTAAAVRDAFAQRRVQKRYLAVVLGHPRERRAVWRDQMQVRKGDRADPGQGRGARAQTAIRGGGMTAEAEMRVMRLIPGPPALAVIELEPHTGRTHQLRHQCAKRRLPILGDQTYGNFRLNRELARRLGTDRLFLHAQAASLDVTIGRSRVRFTAESAAPAEFTALLRAR